NSGRGIPKMNYGIVPCRSKSPSVRRISDRADETAASPKSEDFAVRNLVKVMPLESAQILLARLRSHAVEQFFNASNVPFLGNLLGKVNPCGIQAPPALAREFLGETSFTQLSERVSLCPLPLAVDIE